MSTRAIFLFACLLSVFLLHEADALDALIDKIIRKIGKVCFREKQSSEMPEAPRIISNIQNDGKEIFAKTIYAEARGESVNGQIWVGWVIKNRAAQNKKYWGGHRIKDVCKEPGQFECWNGCNDITIRETDAYNRIRSWSDELYDAPQSKDPTRGCDHYNNPDKEGYPQWTRNCDKIKKIGNHQFYRSK